MYDIRQMDGKFLKSLLPFLYFSIRNYWASVNKVIEGDREIKKACIYWLWFVLFNCSAQSLIESITIVGSDNCGKCPLFLRQCVCCFLTMKAIPIDSQVVFFRISSGIIRFSCPPVMTNTGISGNVSVCWI